MKILYLCPDHGIPILGRRGCSTHVRETCRALNKRGHETIILASQRGQDDSLTDHLRILEQPPAQSKKLGYDLRNIWHNIPYYRRAKKIIQTEKIDAIYERFSLYAVAGTRLGRKFGLPRILEVNAFLTTEHEHKLHFLRMAKTIERYIVQHAPALVVVSDPLRERLVESGVQNERIVNMPMAVDIDHFQPNQETRQNIRRKYEMENKYVIGYVGSLSGWHGIALLPDLARKILEHRDDFVIFVVGGEEKHLEENRARVARQNLESHIRFIGSVSYEEVPDHVSAMDVALVPDTNYWTCPTKMFEYQASAVPTIAPEYPAIVEAMTHGEEGLIFPPKDMDAAAQCILSLGDAPEKRHAMGQKARTRVCATHSWQNNVDKITTLYEQMLSGKLSLR